MARIVGTRRDDTLNGSEMRDVMIGRGRNDALFGYGGNDDLSGGAGDDVLHGGSGTNVLDGGNGYDVADYADAATGVTVDLQQGTASGGDRQDTLVSIERVVGSAFDDLLIGGDGDDRVEGREGDDVFRSSAGDNLIYGGDGDFDIIDYRLAGTAVTVDLRIPGPRLNGFGGRDTLFGIDGIIGSAFDDRLIGHAGENVFFGSGGKDQIDGEAGFDVIDYAGIDTAAGGIVVDWQRGVVDGAGGGDTFLNVERIAGSRAADTFLGSQRGNQFQGNGGGDTVTLGDGADRVIYVAASDSDAAGGIDRITDLAADDRIDLARVDANMSIAGDQRFRLVRAFTGAAGELTVQYDRASRQTTVSGDVDGDGVADLTILCDGNVTAFVDGWIL